MPAIDLIQLSAQTGGDLDLEMQVLRLFAEDAPIQVERLKAAAPAEQRAIAHRIVGAARAIGANDVARLAGDVESGRGDIAALGKAVDAARAFISAHLGERD